jgi:hypothetical protein
MLTAALPVCPFTRQSAPPMVDGRPLETTMEPIPRCEKCRAPLGCRSWVVTAEGKRVWSFLFRLGHCKRCTEWPKPKAPLEQIGRGFLYS